MDLRVLEELGLSTAEAKIYVALLETGSSKTGKIIDRTKLQSSTVYHVLGSLVEKGLVSYILRGKIKFYQAESPDSLKLFLDEKLRKLNELLPELKEKEKISKHKQNAKVYDGLNGLKTAFNDILTSLDAGDEYYFFQVPKENLFNEQVTLFFRNYHLKRSEKRIKVRGLAVHSAKKKVKEIFKDIPNTNIKYLKEFTPSGVVIYKNKVITLDWDDVPTAFVIQSDAVAISYERFFLQKWKKATR